VNNSSHAQGTVVLGDNPSSFVTNGVENTYVEFLLDDNYTGEVNLTPDEHGNIEMKNATGTSSIKIVGAEYTQWGVTVGTGTNLKIDGAVNGVTTTIKNSDKFKQPVEFNGETLPSSPDFGGEVVMEGKDSKDTTRITYSPETTHLLSSPIATNAETTTHFKGSAEKILEVADNMYSAQGSHFHYEYTKGSGIVLNEQMEVTLQHAEVTHNAEVKKGAVLHVQENSTVNNLIVKEGGTAVIEDSKINNLYLEKNSTVLFDQSSYEKNRTALNAAGVSFEEITRNGEVFYQVKGQQ
jgi:hypothetical protein